MVNAKGSMRNDVNLGVADLEFRYKPEAAGFTKGYEYRGGAILQAEEEPFESLVADEREIMRYNIVSDQNHLFAYQAEHQERGNRDYLMIRHRKQKYI